MARQIVCELKRTRINKYEQKDFVVTYPIEAFFFGGDVIIENEENSKFLYNLGYGNFLGQRMDFCNKRCFPIPSLSFVDSKVDEPSVSHIDEFSTVPLEEEEKAVGHIKLINMQEASDWLEQIETGGVLFLSSEEVIYLIMDNKITVKKWSLNELWDEWRTPHFLKKFYAYKHFRDQGWIVKAGIVFGGDFSLYKFHPERCHSSAVVRIGKEADSLEVTSMKRVLKNVKKALFLASIEFLCDIHQLTPSTDVKVGVTLETSWVRAADLIERSN